MTALKTRLKSLAGACAVALAALIAAPAPATAQTPPPYGLPITLESARKVMAAAEELAVGNDWPVAIAILDSGGHLVMLVRHDNTQLSSVDLAIGKARTALLYKRPSKALDDVISGGGAGLRFLVLKDITPLEGGFPIVQDGKIVGAIGVAGTLAAQNSRIGQAGADALRAPAPTSDAPPPPADKDSAPAPD